MENIFFLKEEETIFLEVWMQNHRIKQLKLMKLFCVKNNVKIMKKKSKLRLLKGLLEAILYFLFSWLTNHHCTKQHRWSVPLGLHQRGHHEALDVIQKQSETCLSLFVPSIVLHRVILKGLSSTQKTSLINDASKNGFITVVCHKWFNFRILTS